MKLIYTILLLVSSIILQAQNKLNLKIVDSKQQPVSYASIFILNTSMGTITNPDGIAKLAYTTIQKNTKIQVSCIGYKNQILSLDSLILFAPKLITIQLKSQVFILPEIRVYQQEILKDAKQIMAKAIDSIKNRLDPNPHIGKYYFRQTHRDDSSMNRLIEAAVSIYDPGIEHKIEDCKYNIDELQSSLDNRDSDFKKLLIFYQYLNRKKGISDDSILLHTNSYSSPVVQKRLIQAFDNNKASFPKYFTATNLIRSTTTQKRKSNKKYNPWFVNGGPLLSKTFLKKHSFKLDTILEYQNETMYKIKILPNSNYPGLEGQRSKFIPVGIAYIRAKDFAIFSLDYGYITNPQYKGYRFRGERYGAFNGKYKYFYLFKIRFKEYQNKLFLSYLYSCRLDYNYNLTDHHKVIQELMNTEIIKNQDTIKKRLHKLNWKGDIYEKLPYHKEFWDNYSILIPTQEEQLLKDNLAEEIKRKRKRY